MCVLLYHWFWYGNFWLATISNGQTEVWIHSLLRPYMRVFFIVCLSIYDVSAMAVIIIDVLLLAVPTWFVCHSLPCSIRFIHPHWISHFEVVLICVSCKQCILCAQWRECHYTPIETVSMWNLKQWTALFDLFSARFERYGTWGAINRDNGFWSVTLSPKNITVQCTQPTPGRTNEPNERFHFACARIYYIYFCYTFYLNADILRTCQEFSKYRCSNNVTVVRSSRWNRDIQHGLQKWNSAHTHMQTVCGISHFSIGKWSF